MNSVTVDLHDKDNIKISVTFDKKYLFKFATEILKSLISNKNLEINLNNLDFNHD